MHDATSLPPVPHDSRLLRREQITFLLLSAALSWPLMIPVWLALPADFVPGDRATLEAAFGSWLLCFGAGPMLAATAVTAWFRGRAGLGDLWRRVVRLRVSPRWYLLALMFPPVYQWPAAWLWGAFTGTAVDYPPFAAYLASWLQIAAFSALYFLTEELGWRGFLLPRALVRSAWPTAAVRVGLIWAVWHYPYWLTASWGASGNALAAVAMTLASTVFACALSVMMTWLFRHTRGSVFLAMLFHGSNNANMDKLFKAAGDAAHGLSFLLATAATAGTAAALLILLVRKDSTRRT